MKTIQCAHPPHHHNTSQHVATKPLRWWRGWAHWIVFMTHIEHSVCHEPISVLIIIYIYIYIYNIYIYIYICIYFYEKWKQIRKFNFCAFLFRTEWSTLVPLCPFEKLFTARLNIFGNAVTVTITFKFTLLYYDIHQHFVSILSVTEMK